MKFRTYPVTAISAIGSVLSFLMAAYYTVTFFSNDVELYKLFTHVGLFWIIFFIFTFIRKQAAHGIVFALLGYLTLYLGSPGNMWGIIFLCFASQAFIKKRIIAILFIGASAAIFYKAETAGLPPASYIIYITGAAVLVLVYYMLNIGPNEKINIVKEIKNDEILDRMAAGQNTKSIAHDLKITQSAVNKHLKKVRDQSGYKSNAQLFFFYNGGKFGNTGNNSDNGGQ